MRSECGYIRRGVAKTRVNGKMERTLRLSLQEINDRNPLRAIVNVVIIRNNQAQVPRFTTSVLD